MRTKILSVLSIFILASILSACSPVFTVQPQPPIRSMNVTGTGQVFLKPDIAYIYIGVHTEGISVAEVVAQNTTATQKVTDALLEFGVAKEDIRTTNFSIWPQTKYDEMGQPTGTSTYTVDNTVYVTVRDLAKLGELLDTTIQAGANSINSIQFDVADKTQALTDARKAAVENAQKLALELAGVSGVKLGEIQSVNFYDSLPMPYMDAYGKGGGGAMEAAVPVQPGQLTLTVTVNLTYELK